MKKLTLLLMLGILAMGVTSAFSWGHGNGHGGWHANEHGYWGRDGGSYNNNGYNVTPLTADEAKNKVAGFIKESNLKGYNVIRASDSAGGVNTVVAKDASGNEMFFYVNPYGQISGPVVK